MTPLIHALHGCQGDKGRLQAEVEAKDAEVDRQQREIETLKVRKRPFSAMYEDIMTSSIHALAVRRTKEGCRQRWRLRKVKFSSKAQNWKRGSISSTSDRESYRH